MQHQNTNLQFPGFGVSMFALIVFCTLLFWNVYSNSKSNLQKTIKNYLIFGIVYSVFSAAFFMTNGLDPYFYKNLGAHYDLMLVNITGQFMVLFNVIYIRKKTSKTGSAKDIFCLVVYVLNTVLAIAYIANGFLSSKGAPFLNYLNSSGVVVYSNVLFFRIAMNINIIIMLVPFVFIFQAWKSSLRKERILLLLFAIIPWLCYVLKLLVYNGAEFDLTFPSYSILGILMVFFDQVQLDDSHEKQRALAEKLAFEAMHDKLTGLTVEALFKEQVEEFLSANGSNGCCFAIIDIDEFRDINSTYGRQFGDEVLKASAELLSTVIRPDDIAGRIGGDEFGVFFKCDVRYFDSLVSKMRDKLEFEYDGVPISASIGAARVSDNDSDYEYLFALSDKSLRQAKREGASTYKLVSK